jgi:uncharacterized SAM-binding protein YcdF (DUF218 family)
MTSLGRVLWLLAVVWVGGLFCFTIDALRPSETSTASADAIIVLTGDADRVDTGLGLLAQNRAPRLLISGAGPRLSLAELARRHNVGLAWLTAHVTLGREAISTWGNGSEFAAWAAAQHIDSALVVTSYYHMRRGLMELHRAAPNVRLIEFKVPASPHFQLRDLRKLINDYNKYLLAAIGLSRFSPGHHEL